MLLVWKLFWKNSKKNIKKLKKLLNRSTMMFNIHFLDNALITGQPDGFQ
jgi:hypothetical protein